MKILPVIVVGCLAVLSPAALAAPPQERQEAPNQTDVEQPRPTLESENSPQILERQLGKPCLGNEEDRRSDLCAQWKAADAAERGANWTANGFWIQLGGLIVGTITMFAAIAAALFAKDASYQAKRAADSSDDMTQEARKSTLAAVSAAQGDRAWILPTGLDYGPFQNGTLDGKVVGNGFAFVPKFKNFGNSPALEVSASRHFEIRQRGMKPPAFPFRPEELGGLMPPHQDFSTKMVVLDDAETRAFRAGQTIVYINVQTSYLDIHGHKRTSEFTYSAEHRGGMKGDATGRAVEAVEVMLSPVGQKAT